MNKTYNNNPKQAGNNMNNDRTNRIVCSSLVARLLKNPARLLRTFSLKSYLTFLSRNKAYTAVNIFGLAVSLMFVIIIGLYTWQETSIDRQHSKGGRIYNIGLKLNDSTRCANCHHMALSYLRNNFPEIEKTCGFTTEYIKMKDKDNFINAYVLETDSTFFDLFDFPLLRGNRATCLMQKGSIVVTESFARRLFGNTDIVGRSITATNDQRFRVTGVVADFDNTVIEKNVDAIIDFSFCSNIANKDEYYGQYTNLAMASSFVQVREGCDFGNKQKSIDECFKKFMSGVRPILTPLNKLYFSGLQASSGLSTGNPKLVKILFAVGVIIMLFSIMNYVNLTVAQSGYRAREMATRRLFGCSKSGVAVNMFIESLVMCAISLVIAAAFTYTLAPYAGRLLDTKLNLMLLFQPCVMAGIVFFAILISAIAGTIPAVTLSEVKPVEVVRGTFRKQTKMVFSRIFITVQNVITIVMLACALIMSLQMRHLTKAPLGFNTENIICMDINPRTEDNSIRQFVDELRALPFVKHVALSQGTPVDVGAQPTVTFPGDKNESSFNIIAGTPEILDIYGITIKKDLNVRGNDLVYLNGRALQYFQMQSDNPRMSDRFNSFKELLLGENAKYGGVINDFQTCNILNAPKGLIIQTYKDIRYPNKISVLVEGDATEAYLKIKDVYRHALREEVIETKPVFIDKQIEYYFRQELRTSKIVSLFAFITIVISLLGLVAMSTYFIQQRAREIAVRKVFGSTDSQIQRRLIHSFLAYVGIAFVMAVPVTVHFMSNWIAQYSYRIVWWPWIIASGIIVLLISFAAVAVQSRIAARENPVKNIKQE